MFNLQKQLDKRLADLKKKPGAQQNPDVSPAQIKLTLQQSGILSKSGKVRTLETM